MKTMIFFLFILLTHTIAMADEVHMAFGESLPPFIFTESESGIEIDIVREALAFRGHTLKPIFLPMARIVLAYKAKNVDAIMMDVGDRTVKEDGHYSDIPVIYKNVFITLKSRKIKIKEPKDLSGLVINGFIGAEKRYPAWLTDVAKAGTYFEKNDQSLQVLQLVKKRIDAALSDINIFKYYFHHSKINDVSLSDFEFHSVLKEDPLEYRPVFRSKKIRDDFNAGLAQLNKKGRISAIHEKYLNEKTQSRAPNPN